jgi:general secretion pathway protein J
MTSPSEPGGDAGFTLIEALVALALTGLLLSALATLTAQWLPNWNRGLDRIQNNEQIAIAMQRIAADLSAAEYVSSNREQKKPLFDGTPLSVTLVRTAIGPNAGIGLDIVRIGEITDRGHLVTIRTRAPFAPFPPGAFPSEQIHTKDPVVLLRAPLRLSFAYAGPDHIYRDDWHDQDKLPKAIMLTLREATSDRVLSVSTVTPVHVDVAAVKAGNGPGNNAKERSEDNNKGGMNNNGATNDGGAPGALVQGGS